MTLGNMTVNSISKLSRLGTTAAYALPSAPTLADLEDTDEEEGAVPLAAGLSAAPFPTLPGHEALSPACPYGS